MNRPVPSPDHAIGSNPPVAATSNAGTATRDLSSTAGKAFDKILSGLGETAASPHAKPMVVAKPIIIAQPAPGVAIPAPADHAPFGPPPSTDPVTPTTAPMAPAQVLVSVVTVKPPPSHDPASAAPASAQAPAKPASKAKSAEGTDSGTQAPVPTTLPPPEAASALVILPQAPPAPRTFGSAGMEHETASATARAPLGLAPHEAEGAPSDQSAAPDGLPGIAATATAVPNMAATSALMSAGMAPAPAPAPVPVPASVAATPATVAGRPAVSPAAQLEPALVQVGQAAGLHHITIRLDPIELGSVAIRIDRGGDGTAAVQVTVERPETLQMLLSDQPQLHRALDAAGLPQEGRTVTVSLAPPDPGSAGGSSGSPGNDGSGSANPGNGGFGGRHDDRPGQRSPRAIPIAGTANPTSGWQRAGVDITA